MGASSSKKKANEQEPKKEVIKQEPKKEEIKQEPEKKVIEQEPKKIETRTENTIKKKVEEEEETEPENYFYCLREREISFIEEKKEKKDKDFKSGKIQANDKFYPLFRKFEIDLTKQETTAKDILVLYIPKRYNKKTLIYELTPVIDHMCRLIEEKEPNEYVKYTKINNSKKALKQFKCKQNPEREYASYLTSLEFVVSPEYKEKNLVTIETCYKVNLNERYGLYDFRFCMGYEDDEEEKEKDDGSLKRASISFIFDDNYIPCHIYKDYFDEISKYKLYSFNKNDMSLTMKDKRIKMNIENELDEEYLSKFSPDEIKQINESLNKIEYHYNFRHLIYQKVIHNIKGKKDYIKAYFIVFYPHPSGSCMGSEGSPIKNKQPILVKRFTINNLLVKKEKKYKGDYEDEDEGDNNEEESISEEDPNEEVNEEGIDMFENGYYLSSHKYMEFYLMSDDTWAFYEFDCESNEKLDYFQLNCERLARDLTIEYGSSYKYEIILNGHKIKFPNENLKYSVNNGKIILQGFIDGNKDNFDEKKFEQLAKKYNREWYLNENDEEYRIRHWAELRLYQFLPQTMKLV